MSSVRAKRADTRRQEIVVAATHLFLDKGYEETRIIDIVKKVGIAKGTFYHHFQSKEDLLGEVISNTIGRILNTGSDIAMMEGVNAIDKIWMVHTSIMSQAGSQFLGWLRQMMFIDPGMIARIMVSIHPNQIDMITSSVLTPIVFQGIEEELFHTEYPKESAHAMFHLIIDHPLWSIGPEEVQEKVRMLAYMASNILGARQEVMSELFQKMIDDNLSTVNGAI